MPSLNVLDSTIFYEDAGTGTPFVFLHGNPTSSYLWRHVAPAIATPARRLAPDLIGMGRSGKPDIAYSFDDHARYIEAWFDELALDDVVLIGHDWGGALAFDWATRHAERVRGIAFMETIVRPMTWENLPNARPRYEALRTAGVGETKVLDENFFIEQALRATVLKGLSEEDHAVYAAPYQTRESRRPLLAWPRSMPIEGEPADVIRRIETYDAWLAENADVPKLLLTFEGPPETLLIGEPMTAWCRANIANLDVRNCGPARHNAPEDQPEAIAAAISDWADRHALFG
ncbi:MULTISPECIES: haloalkane dehalogenase [Rhizobium]|uniref:Haloalkane dehalogenase n=1 Tax=Rhizobium tropici TaxID=398 RepID=A0A329YI25_RHITR|nr:MULTISPECIES: haloalkane dehalogenase [Rhizobium]MBB3291152.1 haloalkane dehalogenase [Rhizobium sp. BK252]MBB3404186.1 haloalkane dehalogenase [Rhizobium sp. BK289]MBB3418508.1 haloalkane dehalogenase [Rhizobium sp. BK284]MBB3486386.1 haloalkane dehalogenase [Rhizobium sp. BK347]MDK4724053.1 haloalkane dehalogenase [Rhizobium sp. CNPSo 3968]